MDPSLSALSVVVALLLGFTSTCQAEKLSFCQEKCPTFTLNKANKNTEYEERLYDPSVWVCTHASPGTVMAARTRLKNFFDDNNIDRDTWPVRIEVREVNNVKKYSMCWYVLPTQADGLTGNDEMTVEPFGPTTMFVRSFGGLPSISAGEENADILRRHLSAAKKSFDHNVYHGVGYESYFALTHHDEVWIQETKDLPQ